MEIHLPPLHPGQHQIRTSKARFKAVAAGRRWGKTRVGSALATATCLQQGRCWWVAPTYQIAAIAWRQIKALALQLPQVDVKEGEKTITYLGGGFMQMKTADNPTGLRGEGLDLVIIDEAAHVSNWDEVWWQALRPALSDRQGKALMISTPKGHNHFHDLYQMAQTDADWASWHFPSWSNPYLAPEEIEAARQQLPGLVFRQEYGAEFVQLSGALVQREWITILDHAPSLVKTVRAWDLAVGTKTHNDFTAGVKLGLTAEGGLVVLDVVHGRWEWPEALKIIRQTAVMDGSGVSQGIEDVGTQKGLYQMLLREPALTGIALHPLSVHKDKITRANPWMARAEQGKFALLRASWNQTLLNEICAVPESVHDDIWDAISGATQLLTGVRRWLPVGE